MRAQSVRLSLALLAIAFYQSSAQLQYLIVSEGEYPIVSTVVAISPEGEIDVAWDVDDEDDSRFRFFNQGSFSQVYLWPGRFPDLCWSEYGFSLATAYQNTCAVWTGGAPRNPSIFEVFYQDYWEEVVEPRLTSVDSEFHSASVLLAWEAEDKWIGLSALVAGDWVPMEEQLWEISDLHGYPIRPQLQPLIDGTLQLYFYSCLSDCLTYTKGQIGGTWTGGGSILEDQNILGPIYDTATGPLGEQAVLGLGGGGWDTFHTIHFIEQLSIDGPWVNLANLTVNFGFYDYIDSPNLAIAEDGTVHAFWHQRAEDENHVPVANEMLYFIRAPGGTWENCSHLFDRITGDRLSMALNPNGMPVFTFVTGDGPSTKVWLALDPVVTSQENSPSANLSLYAVPNPFNPKTTLHLTLPMAGDLELGIYDLAGRRVATLLDEPREAGEVMVAWDGCDTAGHRCASGLYLAQATVPGYSSVEKLVMLK